MLKIRSFFIAFFLTGLLSACDSNTPQETQTNAKMTVTHDLGETEINENPTRVVVFNTATLDTMDALNINIIGVPQSGVHYPEYLKKYTSKEYVDVGTLFEPNYEKLSELNPDLIVSGGRTLDAYVKLSEIAPTIALGNATLDFKTNLINSVTELGLIFHKQEEAAHLITQFEETIASIHQQTAPQATQQKTNHQNHQVEQKQNIAMVLMINGGKFSSYGPGSRFGFIFDALGFQSPEGLPVKGKGQHGNIVSSELIAKINPNWIFVINRDNAIGTNQTSSESIFAANPILARTQAFQNKRIIYLNSDEIYIGGGYQAYMKLMQQIELAFKASN